MENLKTLARAHSAILSSSLRSHVADNKLERFYTKEGKDPIFSINYLIKEEKHGYNALVMEVTVSIFINNKIVTFTRKESTPLREVEIFEKYNKDATLLIITGTPFYKILLDIISYESE